MVRPLISLIKNYYNYISYATKRNFPHRSLYCSPKKFHGSRPKLGGESRLTLECQSILPGGSILWWCRDNQKGLLAADLLHYRPTLTSYVSMRSTHIDYLLLLLISICFCINILFKIGNLSNCQNLTNCCNHQALIFWKSWHILIFI